MPLFEYRCTDCGSLTEQMVLAGDTDRSAPSCAKCGSGHTSRMLSTFAAHGTHKENGGFDGMCGGGECETPAMCGTGACGMGGMGGMGGMEM